MKKTKFFLGVLLIVFLFSGCETMKGIGRDLENTGENIGDYFGRLDR